VGENKKETEEMSGYISDLGEKVEALVKLV